MEYFRYPIIDNEIGTVQQLLKNPEIAIKTKFTNIIKENRLVSNIRHLKNSLTYFYDQPTVKNLYAMHLFIDNLVCLNTIKKWIIIASALFNN